MVCSRSTSSLAKLRQAAATAASTRSKAAPSAAGSGQESGSKDRKPPLPSPEDALEEVESSRAGDEEESEEEETRVEERERSVSASAATRQEPGWSCAAMQRHRGSPPPSEHGAGALEPLLPQKLRVAGNSKSSEASSSLKRPHSSGKGSSAKRDQSVAFKEGNRRWDRMVTKKEIDDLDEAEELRNHLRGKASKVTSATLVMESSTSLQQLCSGSS